MSFQLLITISLEENHSSLRSDISSDRSCIYRQFVGEVELLRIVSYSPAPYTRFEFFTQDSNVKANFPVQHHFHSYITLLGEIPDQQGKLGRFRVIEWLCAGTLGGHTVAHRQSESQRQTNRQKVTDVEKIWHKQTHHQPRTHRRSATLYSVPDTNIAQSVFVRQTAVLLCPEALLG